MKILSFRNFENTKLILTTIILIAAISIMLFFIMKYWVYGPWTSGKVDKITQVYRECLRQMGKNTCRVMTGPPFSQIPEGTTSVLISGYGAVSVEVYRNLKESSYMMCDLVKSSCDRSQTEEICRLGQALYLR